MSVQIAMLAGMAAMSAFAAVQKGQAEARGLEGQAAGAEVQGASTDVQSAEVKAQAAQEEVMRRAGLLRLMQANRAEIAGRGVSAEQGSSFDVIQDYNKTENDRDVGNIRFMAESQVRRLSFAKAGYEMEASQYRSMAGGARLSGWLGAARAIGGAAFSYFGMGGIGTGGGAMASAGTPGSPYYGPVYSGTN